MNIQILDIELRNEHVQDLVDRGTKMKVTVLNPFDTIGVSTTP